MHQNYLSLTHHKIMRCNYCIIALLYWIVSSDLAISSSPYVLYSKYILTLRWMFSCKIGQTVIFKHLFHSSSPSAFPSSVYWISFLSLFCSLNACVLVIYCCNARCINESTKCSICIVGEAGDSKTEQWTWAQYLEESKAVAAPSSLFQEVCMSLIFRL